MSQGPSLIFDKSSLESLNIHEAALMDNFYMSTITPLFFVECLADLEKQLKSGSHAGAAGRLAGRPDPGFARLSERSPYGDPERRTNSPIRHQDCLRTRRHGPRRTRSAWRQKGRRLSQKQGAGSARTLDQAPVSGCGTEYSQTMAKITHRVDFDAMVKHVMRNIGPWRTPKTLEDAKQLADTIIDYLDTEWLLRFGLDLLGFTWSHQCSQRRRYCHC